MEFKTLMFKPSNEHELFMKVAEEIHKNYSTFHRQHRYIHLKDCGEQKSLIDEVQDFTKVGDPQHYTYVERANQACILIRSDKDSIAMLLYGEYQSGQLKITVDEVKNLWGPHKSSLPGARRSKLTPMQTREAFGLIGNELKKSRGNKVS